MKISELAQVAQCSVETVRYYEKERLLPAPERTAANCRSYTTAHVERLRFIRNCRALNMTHDEIRRLLDLWDRPSDDCGAVDQLLHEHITHVDVRIAELSELKQRLNELRQRCKSGQTVDTCGILQGLASMKTEPRHNRHTHLG
jgi:Cd(II)/Pb(II)-responsive transcriptional regulator